MITLHRFRALMCLTIPLAQLNCGREESSLSSASNNNPPPLLVTMGGNTSCNQDEWGRPDSPAATNLFRYARHHILENEQFSELNWDYLTTCYTTSDTVNFITSQQPEEIYRVSFSKFQSFLLETVQYYSHVVIMGFSYGGWLAMKGMQAITQANLHHSISFGLITLDPISRVNCTYTWPFGCQSAPTDISRSDRKLIGEAASDWLNFYQTDDFILRSSHIAEADFNQRVSSPHTVLDQNSTVWEGILDNLSQHFFYKSSAIKLVDNQ